MEATSRRMFCGIVDAFGFAQPYWFEPRSRGGGHEAMVSLQTALRDRPPVFLRRSTSSV